MVSIGVSPSVWPAEAIQYVTADEAYSLMCFELDRMLELLEQLEEPDWVRPTACTLWNVRDIAAHQAAGYTSGTGYRAMLHQYAAIPRRGQLPEDAINEFQLKERAGRSPQALIAELRSAGPTAARKWAYQFRLVKPISLPHPVGGKLSVRHLMWVIHSRDTWMHRLDICRATGREFKQFPEHDRRIVELVVLDVSRKLSKSLARSSIIFDLSGAAGGVWKVGQGEPRATVRMDALEFAIFASGRYSDEEAAAIAAFSGDAEFARAIFKKLTVLF